MLQHMLHHLAYNRAAHRTTDLMAELLGTYLKDQVPNAMIDSAWHMLTAHGKLYRPIFVLEACRAVGGDPDAVYPAAAAIELVEIGGTIHDDLLDTEPRRRGISIMQAKFGPGLAALGGTLFYCAAYGAFATVASKVAPDRVLTPLSRPSPGRS